MADHQYAGRGQQGNVWHAEPGLNLTCSILLYPEFLDPSNQYLLNMAVCVAVRDAVHAVLPVGVSVKWPNDIYFSDRKLGGILIENTISGSKYKTAIIGIGINVNQGWIQDGRLSTAISIREILGREFDIRSLLELICIHIEKQYERLRHSRAALIADYHDALYKLSQPALFRAGTEVFEGLIQGVSASGRLILLQGTEVKEYGFKEIAFLTQQS